MSDPFYASSCQNAESLPSHLGAGNGPCCGPQAFGHAGRRGFLRMGLGGFACSACNRPWQATAKGRPVRKPPSSWYGNQAVAPTSIPTILNPMRRANTVVHSAPSAPRFPGCSSPNYFLDKPPLRISSRCFVPCDKRRQGTQRVPCRCSQGIPIRGTSPSPSIRIG